MESIIFKEGLKTKGRPKKNKQFKFNKSAVDRKSKQRQPRKSKKSTVRTYLDDSSSEEEDDAQMVLESDDDDSEEVQFNCFLCCEPVSDDVVSCGSCKRVMHQVCQEEIGCFECQVN